jgi:hypothetical protein
MFLLAPYGARGLVGMGVAAADATYCINAPENSSEIVTVGLFGSRQKTLLEAATLSDIGLLIVATNPNDVLAKVFAVDGVDDSDAVTWFPGFRAETSARTPSRIISSGVDRRQEPLHQ